MIIKVKFAEMPIEEHIADSIQDVRMRCVLISTIPIHHVRELKLRWQRSRPFIEGTFRNNSKNNGRVAEQAVEFASELLFRSVKVLDFSH